MESVSPQTAVYIKDKANYIMWFSTSYAYRTVYTQNIVVDSFHSSWYLVSIIGTDKTHAVCSAVTLQFVAVTLPTSWPVEILV